MYRCIYLLVVFLMLQAPVFAQSELGDRYRKSFDRYKDRKERKFDRYVRKQEDKFDAYRAKVNAEFGAYMKRKWAAYYIKSAFMPPLRKEPVLPPVFVPDDVLPEDITVPSGQILSRPLSEEPVPRPEPVVPFEGDTEDQAADAVSFDFYGTACTVHVPKTRSAGLSGISEEDVSLMWSELSSGAYDASVADCLSLRDRMRLCDWGYLRLVEEISSVMAGDDTNAASVIQFYILTQSGYNVRLSRSG